ncbi:ATP-binding cassette domain-containing protein [Devosia lacusdianchii]|uniref:ATP-binding cassette domain-containing protein n=1 Tax=Devosia lacusdianchii TaxID=2917991 RepID=UPI001F06B1DD|nr:ABC transporter ATP-binding protein [Devosia sp. JXJ CY 41]
MLALVGPNGAGKSSLLRCLYRYHRPSSGLVLLDGDDIWTLSANRWRGALPRFCRSRRRISGSVSPRSSNLG